MSADFSPAFSAWVDALEYANDLTTKEILCMNEAWDAALEWDRCRRIDVLRAAPAVCENCGATERPDKCSGGARCLFPVSTLPWCGCKGPWCEGRDRDAKVQCLGYQIDSDGMTGVGACATCGAPSGLVAVCDDLNARVSALERELVELKMSAAD